MNKTTQPTESFTEYCEYVLALEYYDGPTFGVGVRCDGVGVCFRLIGWDPEHWYRMFLVVAIPLAEVEQIWTAFSTIETPRIPIWHPISDGMGVVREQIRKLIDHVNVHLDQSEELSIVETRNLVTEAIQKKLPTVATLKLKAMVRSGLVLDLRGPSLLEDLESRLK